MPGSGLPERSSESLIAYIFVNIDSLGFSTALTISCVGLLLDPLLLPR